MSLNQNPPRTVKYPQGHVILRNLSKEYPIIDRGEGMYLFDSQGKRYIDGSGGALVISCGHGNQEIAQGVFEQMKRVSYVNGMQFTSQAVEDFSERLTRNAPGSLKRVGLLSSGSEAIEAAVKFVRQLWVERGRMEKGIFIARSPGYHGNTLFALSASARPYYRKFFGPLLIDVPMTEAPYEYRSPVTDYWNAGADYYVKQLEELILKIGAQKIAGFLIEPVSGSSIGATVPPHGYLKKVQELCRKHEILVIADEVLCGSGRCGSLFTSTQFDFEPDVMVLGKGINSGVLPMSAVIVREEHLAEMKQASGGFMHAQTYMHSPSLAATGLAVLDYFEKYNVIDNAKTTGAYLQKTLREQILPLNGVGHVAGMGMLAGVEFVQDKATKKPFDRAHKKVEGFITHCFGKGLILWPNTGQADGTNGDLVMIGPPLNTTPAQIDEIVALLKDCVTSYFV